ncbi:hypothetical protein CEUSTIGMA_g4557.t1 [Chlamydomonas eustigma]|uniref:Uncharacterized protein n=1 Tax=Chlamydomonas eustigma TaxID=1157962 RepID=A0A250X213_9CHLO|nr:hypothetical protein CEUSTIGMA_g4557.t1 [Chlamydomonas eustigma]|eukprot:GAX77111.1 hypothetical protein CEUSTIGMA_g4557.t1 [Chlamydomonas eustigma]
MEIPSQTERAQNTSGGGGAASRLIAPSQLLTLLQQRCLHKADGITQPHVLEASLVRSLEAAGLVASTDMATTLRTDDLHETAENITLEGAHSGSPVHNHQMDSSGTIPLEGVHSGSPVYNDQLDSSGTMSQPPFHTSSDLPGSPPNISAGLEVFSSLPTGPQLFQDVPTMTPSGLDLIHNPLQDVPTMTPSGLDLIHNPLQDVPTMTPSGLDLIHNPLRSRPHSRTHSPDSRRSSLHSSPDHRHSNSSGSPETRRMARTSLGTMSGDAEAVTIDGRTGTWLHHHSSEEPWRLLASATPATHAYLQSLNTPTNSPQVEWSTLAQSRQTNHTSPAEIPSLCILSPYTTTTVLPGEFMLSSVMVAEPSTDNRETVQRFQEGGQPMMISQQFTAEVDTEPFHLEVDGVSVHQGVAEADESTVDSNPDVAFNGLRAAERQVEMRVEAHKQQQVTKAQSPDFTPTLSEPTDSFGNGFSHIALRSSSPQKNATSSTLRHPASATKTRGRSLILQAGKVGGRYVSSSTANRSREVNLSSSDGARHTTSTLHQQQLGMGGAVASSRPLSPSPDAPSDCGTFSVAGPYHCTDYASSEYYDQSRVSKQACNSGRASSAGGGKPARSRGCTAAAAASFSPDPVVRVQARVSAAQSRSPVSLPGWSPARANVPPPSGTVSGHPLSHHQGKRFANYKEADIPANYSTSYQSVKSPAAMAAAAAACEVMGSIRDAGRLCLSPASIATKDAPHRQRAASSPAPTYLELLKQAARPKNIMAAASSPSRRLTSSEKLCSLKGGTCSGVVPGTFLPADPNSSHAMISEYDHRNFMARQQELLERKRESMKKEVAQREKVLEQQLTGRPEISPFSSGLKRSVADLIAWGKRKECQQSLARNLKEQLEHVAEGSSSQHTFKPAMNQRSRQMIATLQAASDKKAAEASVSTSVLPLSYPFSPSGSSKPWGGNTSRHKLAASRSGSAPPVVAPSLNSASSRTHLLSNPGAATLSAKHASARKYSTGRVKPGLGYGAKSVVTLSPLVATAAASAKAGAMLLLEKDTDLQNTGKCQVIPTDDSSAVIVDEEDSNPDPIQTAINQLESVKIAMADGWLTSEEAEEYARQYMKAKAYIQAAKASAEEAVRAISTSSPHPPFLSNSLPADEHAPALSVNTPLQESPSESYIATSNLKTAMIPGGLPFKASNHNRNEPGIVYQTAHVMKSRFSISDTASSSSSHGGALSDATGTPLVSASGLPDYNVDKESASYLSEASVSTSAAGHVLVAGKGVVTKILASSQSRGKAVAATASTCQSPSKAPSMPLPLGSTGMMASPQAPVPSINYAAVSVVDSVDVATTVSSNVLPPTVSTLAAATSQQHASAALSQLQTLMGSMEEAAKRKLITAPAGTSLKQGQQAGQSLQADDTETASHTSMSVYAGSLFNHEVPSSMRRKQGHQGTTPSRSTASDSNYSGTSSAVSSPLRGLDSSRRSTRMSPRSALLANSTMMDDGFSYQHQLDAALPAMEAAAAMGTTESIMMRDGIIGRCSAGSGAASAGTSFGGAEAAEHNARLVAHRETSILVPVTLRGLVSAAYMHSLAAAKHASSAETQRDSHSLDIIIASGQQTTSDDLEGVTGNNDLSLIHNRSTASPQWPGLAAMEAAAAVSSSASARSSSCLLVSPRPAAASVQAASSQALSSQNLAALTAVENAALCDLIERELEELVRPHLNGMQPLQRLPKGTYTGVGINKGMVSPDCSPRTFQKLHHNPPTSSHTTPHSSTHFTPRSGNLQGGPKDYRGSTSPLHSILLPGAVVHSTLLPGDHVAATRATDDVQSRMLAATSSGGHYDCQAIMTTNIHHGKASKIGVSSLDSLGPYIPNSSARTQSVREERPGSVAAAAAAILAGTAKPIAVRPKSVSKPVVKAVSSRSTCASPRPQTASRAAGITPRSSARAAVISPPRNNTSRQQQGYLGMLLQRIDVLRAAAACGDRQAVQHSWLAVQADLQAMRSGSTSSLPTKDVAVLEAANTSGMQQQTAAEGFSVHQEVFAVLELLEPQSHGARLEHEPLSHSQHHRPCVPVQEGEHLAGEEAVSPPLWSGNSATTVSCKEGSPYADDSHAAEINQHLLQGRTISHAAAAASSVTGAARHSSQLLQQFEKHQPASEHILLLQANPMFGLRRETESPVVSPRTSLEAWSRSQPVILTTPGNTMHSANQGHNQSLMILPPRQQTQHAVVVSIGSRLQHVKGVGEGGADAGGGQEQQMVAEVRRAGEVQPCHESGMTKVLKSSPGPEIISDAEAQCSTTLLSTATLDMVVVDNPIAASCQE